MCIIINFYSSYIAHAFRYLSPIYSLLLRDRRMRLSWLLIDTQFYFLRHKMLYLWFLILTLQQLNNLGYPLIFWNFDYSSASWQKKSAFNIILRSYPDLKNLSRLYKPHFAELNQLFYPIFTIMICSELNAHSW